MSQASKESPLMDAKTSGYFTQDIWYRVYIVEVNVLLLYEFDCLNRGILGKYSRPKMYHKRGLWAIKAKNGGAFRKHEKKVVDAAPAVKPPKFYPADDVKKPVSTNARLDPPSSAAYFRIVVGYRFLSNEWQYALWRSSNSGCRTAERCFVAYLQSLSKMMKNGQQETPPQAPSSFTLKALASHTPRVFR
ncbi:60S ribosomal protein L6-3 [Tanacetum coccineum]